MALLDPRDNLPGSLQPGKAALGNPSGPYPELDPSFARTTLPIGYEISARSPRTGSHGGKSPGSEQHVVAWRQFIGDDWNYDLANVLPSANGGYLLCDTTVAGPFTSGTLHLIGSTSCVITFGYGFLIAGRLTVTPLATITLDPGPFDVTLPIPPEQITAINSTDQIFDSIGSPIPPPGQWFVQKCGRILSITSFKAVFTR